MSNASRLRVFISYAREDVDHVRVIYQRLKQESFIVPWMDEDQLLPGQEWGREIELALRHSQAILLFLSRKSIAKEGFVQREVRRALDIAKAKPPGAIFIIPIRLEECEMPFELEAYQWLDIFRN